MLLYSAACLSRLSKENCLSHKQYLIIHNNNLVMLRNDYRRHRRTDPADTFYNPKFMSCSLLYGREMTWKVGGLTRYHLAPVFGVGSVCAHLNICYCVFAASST